jgi:hypothetical protein
VCEKERERGGRGELGNEEKTAALHNKAWMKVKIKMKKCVRRLCVT